MARIKSMPFPGESPTVSLALAAGRKYGLKDEKEKPRRATKRRTATKNKGRARAR